MNEYFIAYSSSVLDCTWNIETRTYSTKSQCNCK